MRPRSHPALILTMVVLFALLYAPILVVLLQSFSASPHALVGAGYTTRWYAALTQNATAMGALRNSLELAVVSTLLSTAIGTLLGLGLSRGAFPGRRWIERSLQLPVILPDIVMAVSILLFSHWVRRMTGLLELGMPTMILAHTTFQIPFVAMVVRARRAGMDPHWEEAARDLGANARQCFIHVTLPLLWPGILAGALLAFALSLDDFVVSFFTSGPGSTTLPILIHASVRRGMTPEIHALSSLLIGAAMLLTLCSARVRRESNHSPLS